MLDMVHMVVVISESHGGIAKWLRQRSAKPLFSGSNPDAASIQANKAGTIPAFSFAVPVFSLFKPSL